MDSSLATITTPLTDQQLVSFQPALQKLQGNILKGHGRDHTVHIFVQFTAPPAQVRNWLKQYSTRLTSAAKQFKESEDFNKFGIPGALFSGLLLTAKGYQYLQLSTSGMDPNFLAGMRASGASLNDPAPSTWDAGYQGTIHAMFLLADDGENFLLREARALMDELEQIGVIQEVEQGSALRNEHGDTIEHFGYVDGRSQPILLARDLAKESDGTTVWDPSAGPNIALVDDHLGGSGACGSYFVFRKLEQNVKGFKSKEQDLADALGLVDEDRERAGAMVVGRFENGTPVTLQADDTAAPLAVAATTAGTSITGPTRIVVKNNFTYDNDLAGQKCPFQGHIRKTNPRGSGPGGLADEKTHRIVRRGITYGQRTDDFEDIDQMPTGGVGLLFMCFQRTIANQFEFIQRMWANNESFPQGSVGLDPSIGQGSSPSPQVWPTGFDTPPTVPFSFNGFVRLRGGEYFFAPSITTLSSLH